MLTVAEALDRIIASVAMAPAVPVPLSEALGCVLVDDVHSTIDSPPFDKSTMDGFAVRTADLKGESLPLEVIGELTAGQTAELPIDPGRALRIMTGAPIPAGADAVVPVEFTDPGPRPETVSISERFRPREGANIVRQGTSMRQGELLLSAGIRLRAQELSLLAETGVAAPVVRRPPRLAVLATGDELVPVGETPGPGQIRNTNALMLVAQARQMGIDAVDLGTARDNRRELAEKIRSGLEFDFLCLSGGVSKGTRDLVPEELERAGVREVFHRVAMKPGQPIWFGRGRGSSGPCGVFGLPGNPVSSMVCFELFVRTAVRKFLGRNPVAPPTLLATLAQPFTSQGDRPCWFPAVLNRAGERLQVEAAPWKGSFDLRGATSANCSLCVPAGAIQWEAGRLVEVLPWSGNTEWLD